MTTITDADREAAAQYFEAIDGPRTPRASNARLGRMDHLQTVQAFARHREAALEEAAKEKYVAFTDGMEAAAQICGSMAETTYDDADGFEAATGCEAAIMAVVKQQRKEQSAIRALKGNNDAG